MEYARSFRDIEVYKLARKLASDIFELTKSFPKEEMYSLTDQMSQPSRSVGAQIAEAWGKRKYEKHFVSKLTDADCEQLETQHWLETAIDNTYFSAEKSDYFLNQYAILGRMPSSMISKSDKFCKSP